MAFKSNYYQLLGLEIDANEDDIKRSYKKLAVKYHPDKTSDKKLNDLFIKVQEAYDTLKNPDKRKDYDVRIGVQVRSSFTNGENTSSGNFSHQTQSKSSKMPGYFGFYQHFYRSFERKDVDERNKKAQEKAEHLERQNEALKAARLAKKMEERIKREAEEKIRIAKEQERERKRNQFMHEGFMGGENEHRGERAAYLERKREAFRKEWENNFKFTSTEEKIDSNNLYNQRDSFVREPDSHTTGKASADDYDDVNTTDSSKQGNNATDPIVVEDDEVDNNISEKVQNNSNEAESTKQEGKSSNSEPAHDEGAKNNMEEVALKSHREKATSNSRVELPRESKLKFKSVDEIFDSKMHIRPKPEPSKLSQRWRSPSPSRSKNMNPNPGYKPHEEPPATKRRKNENEKVSAFSFEDLKSHLGTNIDTLDFNDIYASLPKDNSSPKDRKMSQEESMGQRLKRPKVSEYSNGVSKAETLHIPINKNPVKGHSMRQSQNSILTMLDFHASPVIHNYNPPVPPRAILEMKLTEDSWFKYVSSMQKYQQDFSTYRNHIIQYQMERSAKDNEYFGMINSSSSTFETYQKCLERDSKVLNEFIESLTIYSNTLKVFKQNCNWVKMSGFLNE